MLLGTGLVILAMLGSIAAGAHADPGKLSLDLANSLSMADSRGALAQQVVGISAAKNLPAFAAPGASATEGPRFRVVVQTRAATTRSLRQRFVRTGATVGRSFANLGATVIEATPEQIIALSNDPNVTAISPDRAVLSSAEIDVNRRAVGVGSDGSNGGGGGGGNRPSYGPPIGVAVIDSGVAQTSDIWQHLGGFKDFVNNRSEPYDDFGHGTHVAGIIAGDGRASSTYYSNKTYLGVASNVNIVGVKVLQADGTGSISNVIAGIDWCIANRDAYNIRVINLSLGGGVFESHQTDPLCQAAERAVSAGIVVVTSAGNWGGVYGGIGSPANDPEVITVGASNARGTVARNDDVITTYTGRGPSRFDLCVKPDLVAPGNRIVSSRVPGSFIDSRYAETRVPTSEYLNLQPGDKTESAYTRLSGTSMAAPMVAAAAAQVLQANPSLTPNGVKAALMYSAQLLTGYDPVRGAVVTYDPFTQGAGELNLPGAVALASLMTPKGLTAQPPLSSTIGGIAFLWSGATIPSLLERPNGAWGDNLLANSGMWASSRLWDNGVRWTDNLVWAGNGVWGGAHDDPKLAFMVPADPDLIWATTQIWGGANSTINYDNLFLNGSALIPASGNLVWAGNGVWGGAHDDPKLTMLTNGDNEFNPY